LFGFSFLIFGLSIYGVYAVRMERIRLRNETIDANLRALRAQIKPHFLSNILHSVQQSFESNRKQDAVSLLSSFGKMVRRILDTSDQNFILVTDEIRQLKEYLEFECKRTHQNIDYDIIVQEEYSFDDVYLPTMLIQPILENALIHGFGQREQPDARIELHLFMINDVESKPTKEGFDISKRGRLLVSVRDNGIGRAAAARKPRSGSKSFGVRSLDEKIGWIARKFKTVAFGVVVDLLDDNDQPCGTMVTLNLPLLFKDRMSDL